MQTVRGAPVKDPPYGANANHTRSVTPGEGYLEALQEDNVEIVRTGIQEVTNAGVVTRDGTTYEVDVIIAATGYDTTYVPAFELVGRNGVDLGKRWAVTGAEAYFTCAVPDMPNYFSKLAVVLSFSVCTVSLTPCLQWWLGPTRQFPMAL